MTGEISIAINASMLDEKPTGVGVYSFNLINNLTDLLGVERKRNLTVFTSVSSLLNKNIRIKKLPVLLQSSRYGRIAAICRFVWNTFYYPFAARKFHLLISPTTHGSFLLKNQVITIHDLLSLKYRNISAHQRFYFKFFLPALIRRARLIVAVSESTKKDILRYFNCPEDKIMVIHNGYDDLNYYPAEKTTSLILNDYGVKNYLLAVGPTYPHKNFEMLIESYRQLDNSVKKKHPLVIAGGKLKYVEKLKGLVKTLQLEDNVYFLGYVPLHLMPSLYREAFALVFPSLYEGFGIPLLEAMACGCPVLVSNTSSMPEVCGEAVIYFDPQDMDSIVSAISKLVSDKVLYNELKGRGLKQVKQFSWKRMAIKFNTIIEESITNN